MTNLVENKQTKIFFSKSEKDCGSKKEITIFLFMRANIIFLSSETLSENNEIYIK